MELILIQSKIYEIRGLRVMLDFDLAAMYGVLTKRLNEQVKRNIRRFPPDFMFQITKEEWDNLKSQIATSSWGGSRKLPYVFTELGVSMLSSILSSNIAIDVNISIMRAFVAIRNVLTVAKEKDELSELITRVELLEEISEETLVAINDLSEDTRKEFEDIYIALSELSTRQKQLSKPRNPIGYRK
ncbi:ORF6N domain-containing protein [Parabacteroides sp. PF5-6]|uniref:ORF6N domain-containing protein n=1 Tax=Parabacteroides sp. PF5-6 TaxID=1742403 RepID=UPI002406BE2E|nr:ORF6N domain-containing protein [Parabacteroides sp. PF5-6]MDF9830366.1 hypothetical protein [Parabacteroides sp. PF5-6]